MGRKYGHLGGKAYFYDNKRFKSKSEIQIYEYLIKSRIYFDSMIRIGRKEIDFLLNEHKFFIEYHPYHAFYSTIKTSDYKKNRLKIVKENNNYFNYDLKVFTNIKELYGFIDQVSEKQTGDIF